MIEHSGLEINCSQVESLVNHYYSGENAFDNDWKLFDMEGHDEEEEDPFTEFTLPSEDFDELIELARRSAVESVATADDDQHLLAVGGNGRAGRKRSPAASSSIQKSDSRRSRR
jgi:hypothetical protein